MTRRKAGTARWSPLLDKAMAVIALLNLVLVLLDLSYFPLRDQYLRLFPEFTIWYGERFKGIEPHRDTTAYLARVDSLKALGSTDSPQARALLLSLRSRSHQMITENPFAAAGKSGTLERIKWRMRDHMRVDSSRDAFEQFWSRDHLQQAGFDQELAFFDQQIRPLMETNFFRGITIHGKPIDRFWQIDIWFTLLFAADLLIRVRQFKQRFRQASWVDVLFWRWYDLFLLLPFWRWLRVIPVTFRLNQSGLVNLEPMRTRLVHGLVASLATELTEIVLVNTLEQVQALIARGHLSRWILNSQAHRRYIDLNGVDEVEAIARQVITVTVYQVMPQIRPDLEELIQYTVQQVLRQSPVYQNLAQFPGVNNLSGQLTERLVNDLTETTYTVLTQALEDAGLVQRVRDLLHQFGDTFMREISDARSLQELQSLLVDLIDEVKINYIQQVSEQEIEVLREQAQRLYEITQSSKLAKR